MGQFHTGRIVRSPRGADTPPDFLGAGSGFAIISTSDPYTIQVDLEDTSHFARPVGDPFGPPTDGDIVMLGVVMNTAMGLSVASISPAFVVHDPGTVEGDREYFLASKRLASGERFIDIVFSGTATGFVNHFTIGMLGWRNVTSDPVFIGATTVASVNYAEAPAGGGTLLNNDKVIGFFMGKGPSGTSFDVVSATPDPYDTALLSVSASGGPDPGRAITVGERVTVYGETIATTQAPRTSVTSGYGAHLLLRP